MKNYLMANNLWDIVEATTEAPNPEEAEAEFKAWRKKNAAALHAIQISCMPHILFQIKEISSARICWDTLAKMHEVKSPGDQILPVEVLLQLPAAVNPAGTERDVYVEFRPLRNAIEIGIQVQLPAAQHADVRISIPQDGHTHPESILVRGLGPLRRFGSNLLQLFAKLAPPDRLASISGAALQMQRELQWYKEVESIVDPSFQENVNLLLKHLSKNFLINTSTFTVPGGNFQDTGSPIFLHRKFICDFYNIRCNFTLCFLNISIDVLRNPDVSGELKLVIPITF
ncbi:hypothetical protein GH714_005578 [Hevea brasiliensis]|uniref:Uncharacterized protein n=1 Tax=Hevea brasiliensis TaxID=3981 RepID=A0A6A6MZ23_HEVBR|nr:hypothetical protein GH714_005578 [Hevea brasiliensis]